MGRLLRAIRSMHGPVARTLVGGAALALASTASAVPPMQLSRMTFVSSEGGFTDLTVVADAAQVDMQGNKAQLDRVHALWAASNGQNSLDIVCERGEFDLSTNDFVAIGSVHGVLGDGRRFESPWMKYDHAKGVAYTDAPVSILDAGRTLKGGGFRYRIHDGKLRLTSGASVVDPP